MVQSTTWSVSLECSIRIVTSSATSRCRAPASLSSSDFVAARIATGSCGSGSSHGATTAGRSGEERVSDGLGAGQLGDEREVTGDRRGHGTVRVDEGRRERADALVVVVGGVARDLVPDEVAEVARHVHRLVDAQRAGEDAHERQAPDVGVGGRAHDLGDERLRRVARDAGTAPPTGEVTAGSGCTVGSGKARSMMPSSSSTPPRSAATTGTIGKKVPLRDGRAQVGEQRLGVDALALEVAVEQRRVLGLLDDRLDERRPGVLVLGRRSRPSSSPTTPVTEPPSTTGQCVARASPNVRRHVSTVVAKSARGWSRWVTTTARGMPTAAHSRQSSDTGAVDVVGAGDDEDGGVGGPQPGAQVTDEVGVAGGVEEVEGDRAGRRTRRR